MNKIIKTAIPLLIFIIMAGFLWRGLSLDSHHIPSPLINQTIPEFELTSLEDATQIVSKKDLNDSYTVISIYENKIDFKQYDRIFYIDCLI